MPNGDFKKNLELFLERTLSNRPGFPRLYEAMRYTLLNGGKRVRAGLVYLVGTQLKLPLDLLDVLAASVEMVHAFSLIHDDLPGMDNDDMRRGKPSSHIVFGEAIAILAGDALHTEAFSLLSRAPELHSLNAECRLKLIDCLSTAVGSEGMVSGQAMDMTFQERGATLDELISCHRLKTGNLLQASVLLPVIAAGISEKDLKYKQYEHIGELFGLAFQIRDDILDQVSTSEELGKTAGKDQSQNKVTFPALVGLDASQQWVDQLSFEISKFLDELDNPSQELRTFIQNLIV